MGRGNLDLSHTGPRAGRLGLQPSPEDVTLSWSCGPQALHSLLGKMGDGGGAQERTRGWKVSARWPQKFHLKSICQIAYKHGEKIIFIRLEFTSIPH